MYSSIWLSVSANEITFEHGKDDWGTIGKQSWSMIIHWFGRFGRVGRSAVAAKVENIYVKRTVNQLISMQSGIYQTADWTIEESWFDSWYGEEFFVFQSVQSGSRDSHPAV